MHKLILMEDVVKIKGFLKYKTPTTKLDLIIIISSFALSGMIFTKFDVNNAYIFSSGIGFLVMLLIKYIKFSKE